MRPFIKFYRRTPKCIFSAVPGLVNLQLLEGFWFLAWKRHIPEIAGPSDWRGKNMIRMCHIRE